MKRVEHNSVTQFEPLLDRILTFKRFLLRLSDYNILLQKDGVDAGLRNRLWNVIRSTFFSSAPDFRNAPSDYLYIPSQSIALATFKNLWHNYFKETTYSIGTSYLDALNQLKAHFLACNWYEVYDLVEFCADSSMGPHQKSFINSVNEILKQEMSGYRFVSGHIVEITSEEEIVAIEQALSLPDSLKPVREHLNQSLTLLAHRKTPDYRNSIKESISAVESLSKIISKQNKASLGPARNAVEKKTKLHSVLIEAFQKLYGYTSDAQGIRHALMDEPTLDAEDVKFMLVSCSAFVNYLVVKKPTRQASRFERANALQFRNVRERVHAEAWAMITKWISWAIRVDSRADGECAGACDGIF